MNMWIIRDELGEDWEVTPIIRMVRDAQDRVFLEQKYAKVIRVKLAGTQVQRETRWIRVPFIDETQEETQH